MWRCCLSRHRLPLTLVHGPDCAGIFPRLSAADLRFLNPHAGQAASGTEALQGRQRAAAARCANPRINLVVDEEEPQSTGTETRLGGDAPRASEPAAASLPGGSGRERHMVVADQGGASSRSSRQAELEDRGTSTTGRTAPGEPQLVATNYAAGGHTNAGSREESAERQGEILGAGTTRVVQGTPQGAGEGHAAPDSDARASGAVGGKEAALRVEAERTEVVLATTRTVVGLDNLRKYLGRPKWGKERWYAQTPTGVVMGLVTTQAGGQIAYIEAR